jgi:hypothetical protein
MKLLVWSLKALAVVLFAVLWIFIAMLLGAISPL